MKQMYSNSNHVSYDCSCGDVSPKMSPGGHGPRVGNSGDMAGPATAASKHRKPAIKAMTPVKVQYGKK